MSQNNFSLIDIINVLLKRKKLLIISTLVAAIGSIIIALMLPNYYESTGSFSTYNVKTSDSRTLYTGENTFSIFGDKDHTNRLWAFCISAPMYSKIIEEFDLVKHYDIKTTEKYYMTKTYKILDGNLKIIKNDWNGIDITFLDQDSLLAAKVVNRMIEICDEMNKQTLIEHNNKILNVYKTRMKYLEDEMKVYKDSIRSVKKQYNINLPVSKIDFPTLSLLHKNDFLDIITNNEGIAVISDLEDRYWELHNQYLGIKENFYQTKSTVENIGSTIYVIQPAMPSEKHARPVRWLIVVSSTIITLVLISLLIIVLDYLKS